MIFCLVIFHNTQLTASSMFELKLSKLNTPYDKRMHYGAKAQLDHLNIKDGSNWNRQNKVMEKSVSCHPLEGWCLYLTKFAIFMVACSTG